MRITGLYALVTLGCSGDPRNGQLDIHATVDVADGCPSITSATAAPAQTSVGGSIEVSATAFDPDATDTLAYRWNPAARFAIPTAAKTTFGCVYPGAQILTLTVSDDHQPTPCSVTFPIAVSCVAVDANGGL